MIPPCLRAIQSFWNGGEFESGGFLTKKGHLVSWALSALTISKIFPDLHLVTNGIGKHILVDELNLPYTSASLEFDSYQPSVPNEPWPLRKLFVYSLQKAPFLHFDGDVYLWRSLPARIETADLVAQNLALNLPYYSEAYRHLKGQKADSPAPVFPSGEVYGANAGVMGGRCWSFFGELYQLAKKVLIINQSKVDAANLDYIGAFIEEALFYIYAKKKGLTVKYLFDFQVTENFYPSLQEFAQLPDRCAYIHLMRGKSNPLLVNFLTQRIEIEYPHTYAAIKTYLGKVERYQIKADEFVSLDFPRTKLVLDRLGLSFPPCFEENVETGLSPQQKSLVEDVWSFEKARQTFEQAMLAARNISFSFHIQVNKYLAEGQEVFCNRMISISPLVTLIESEWPWAMDYRETLDKARFEAITQLSPSYFLTAVVYPQPEGGIFEYQFDGFGLLIIDALNEPLSIGRLTETLENQTGHIAGTRDAVFTYIRFFLYPGIVEFLD